MKNSWRLAITLDLLSHSSCGSSMLSMSMMDICELLEVRALREVFGFLICGALVSWTSSDVVGETMMMLLREAELWRE